MLYPLVFNIAAMICALIWTAVTPYTKNLESYRQLERTHKTVEIFYHTEPAALPDDVRERLNGLLAQRFRKEDPN